MDRGACSKSVLRAGVDIVRSKGDLAAPVLIGLVRSRGRRRSRRRAGHRGEEEAHDHDDFDSIVDDAVRGCQRRCHARARQQRP